MPLTASKSPYDLRSPRAATMTGASFGTIGAEGLNPGRASDVTPETLLIFTDTPNAFLARVAAAAG
jgi:hypothetical protein